MALPAGGGVGGRRTGQRRARRAAPRPDRESRSSSLTRTCRALVRWPRRAGLPAC